MSQSQLSEKVLELIKKARIVSLDSWRHIYDVQLIEYVQTSDDQGRYLTDAELQEMGCLEPAIAKFIPTVQLLRDQVRAIVDEARSCLLYTSPSPRDRQKSRMPSSA